MNVYTNTRAYRKTTIESTAKAKQNRATSSKGMVVENRNKTDNDNSHYRRVYPNDESVIGNLNLIKILWKLDKGA